MSKILLTFFAAAVAVSAWAAAGTYDDLAGRRTDNDFWKPSRRALVTIDSDSSQKSEIDTYAFASDASDELATFDSRNGTVRFSGEKQIRTGKPSGAIIIVR